ncbi:Coenzyme F420 hydrogenase/dehydrogenase, beta subunit C-terminal domain [Clostridium perfringens]|uniref:Coenzyme F420 hydrogenase/dehydrogenase, beta subunit C-terminal domain n=1 Tax=Clostridium perfringens TaxID=1502 RepID=UPI000DA044FB|nr:Coenzyme F420 hydrogenase/dehydrogenase, beta subunit C-terminal domain [Clostridium perfringens]MDM0859164.1 Coenzyme F420 hydrogenase/dehydrogenase, beta subunit C-terminal domain [Clostridium perfringens]SQB38917.1 coenzyme F420-reducing hydrogenase, beta subunit [Clostridium perfringens]
MINITNKANCHGCHACQSICPKSCISMEEDEKGFWYPKVNKELCVNCNLCEKVCSVINIPKRSNKLSIAYACKNKDNNERLNSSSGGVFIELCKYVLNNNGVVFGAAFDKEFNVIHDWSETLDGCNKFRGSKYVQSKIGEVYKISKKFLDEGRVVLFTGTPCQIAGLDKYLMKKYENLILLDIACHGVPSPLVYRKYINNIKRMNKSKIKNINFRDKSTGWKNYKFKIEFECGEFIQKNNENLYMNGFLQDLYLRDSCYQCKFKKPITSADITLADYWGIEKIHPDFDDDKGTSLILVNTEKGNNIFEIISNDIDNIKTDYEYAVKCNPSIIMPANYNKKIDKFFYDVNKGNYDLEKVIKNYTKVSFIRQFKRKVLKKLKGI